MDDALKTRVSKMLRHGCCLSFPIRYSAYAPYYNTCLQFFHMTKCERIQNIAKKHVLFRAMEAEPKQFFMIGVGAEVKSF